MTVPDLVYNVRANDKSRATFERNRRELAKTRRSTQLLNTDMGTLGRTMTSIRFLPAAAIALSIGKITAEIKSAVSESSKLAKVADKVGVTTDELQRLRYGFALTGVEAGTTDTALQRFSRRIGEAANGSGVLHDILKANGVELRDVTGKMKTQSQLLGEYADLIKNASSEQERLLLSFKAFDREGAGLVLALKNGSEGVRDLMKAADEAGGVIEEGLLRKAEQIDDEFAALWRTFETGAKRATLNAASFLSDFKTFYSDLLSEDQNKSDAGLKVRLGAIYAERDVLRGKIADLGGDSATDPFDLASIERMRADIEDLNREAERFLDIINSRNGFNGGSSGNGSPNNSDRIGQGFALLELSGNKPTIIPDKGSSGGSSRQTADPYSRVLQQLQFERDLLSMNAQEQKRANVLRLAGVEASSKQGQELIKLTDEIYAQTKAQQQANEIAALFGDIAQDSMSEFITALGIADTAAGRLVATLAEAALQAAFLGQGPLAASFGSSPEANLTTALISGFKGFFAGGGVLGAGEWGIAGDNGPEPVVGPARIISNQEAFGSAQRPIVVHQHIQTPDVESFRQSQGQLSALMVDALSRGQRNR